MTTASRQPAVGSCCSSASTPHLRRAAVQRRSRQDTSNQGTRRRGHRSDLRRARAAAASVAEHRQRARRKTTTGSAALRCGCGCAAPRRGAAERRAAPQNLVSVRASQPRSLPRSFTMNFLRKSLARAAAGDEPSSSSNTDNKGRAKSLRISLGLGARQASSSLSPNNTRKAMRDSFDSEAMSLDDKLRARSRTSLRRCNNDLLREPVGW